MRYSILLLVGALNLSLAMNPGTASAAFLKLSVDARAVGMGEGVSAYTKNISCLYYNPAGLAEMGKYDFLFMHNQWLVGMYHEYGAVGYNADKIGSFGLSFNYWGSGSIQGFDERGDTIRINGAPYEFSASDWALAAGYGKALDKISLGVAAKFVSEKNESLSAAGFGIDLGARFYPPIKGLAVGTSISNAGTRLKLDQLSFSLPLLWRLGAGYRMNAVGAAIDIIISNSDKLSTGFGFEYWIAKILGLRLGYKLGSNVDGVSGLRTGLGIKYRGFGIDYAFAPYGSLGMTHRVSVAYGLEPVAKSSRVKKPIRKK